MWTSFDTTPFFIFQSYRVNFLTTLSPHGLESFVCTGLPFLLRRVSGSPFSSRK